MTAAARGSAGVMGFLLALSIAGASDVAAADLAVPFTLNKPAGNGPFPAMVILHDCSGLGPRSSAAPWRWSTRLVAQGYVTIWPDSFSSRGFADGVCTAPTGLKTVDYKTRAGDAWSALAYLRSLPYVDGRRIGVMGGSHGGSSTLASIVEGQAPVAAGDGFAAAIALYPGCAARFGAWSVVRQRKGPGSAIVGYEGVFRTPTPLLILIGERDDWTPAEPCRQLVARAKDAGQAIDIVVYPGAHHAFDSRAPIRFVPDRRNFNAASGRGATTGGDAASWADAIVRVERFLGQNLRTPSPSASPTASSAPRP